MIRPCDMMVVAMSRLIGDGDTVFHGVSSHMPMIATLLAKKTHAPNAVHLNIPGGVDPVSGVQFDALGHVNASVIGDYHKPKVRLPGGAGSAVLIPTARRAIIWRTKHDKRTFTGKVDFVTARGNVSDIVTPLCVFTMHEGELILKSVHPTSSIEEVAANTGFPIRYFSIEQTPPPTSEELRALREIDPMDYRSIEFR